MFQLIISSPLIRVRRVQVVFLMHGFMVDKKGRYIINNVYNNNLLYKYLFQHSRGHFQATS